MTRPRASRVYIPPAVVVKYYRLQAERWQAEAEAQAARAASLQASLCKVLGAVAELGIDTQAKA